MEGNIIRYECLSGAFRLQSAALSMISRHMILGTNTLMQHRYHHRPSNHTNQAWPHPYMCIYSACVHIFTNCVQECNADPIQPPTKLTSCPRTAPVDTNPNPQVCNPPVADSAAILDHGSHIFIWLGKQVAAGMPDPSGNGSWTRTSTVCERHAMRLAAGRFPVPELLTATEVSPLLAVVGQAMVVGGV